MRGDEFGASHRLDDYVGDVGSATRRRTRARTRAPARSPSPVASAPLRRRRVLMQPRRDAQAGLRHRLLEGEPESDKRERAEATPSVHKRLESLDVFRGLTIAWMIFADDIGAAFHSRLDHSPWDNVTFADFVFPFFLFISGASIPLAFQRELREGKRWQLTWKSFVRFAKLFLLGIFLQGGGNPWPVSFDLSTLRIMGILQRIGTCYFVCALFEIWLQPSQQLEDDLAAREERSVVYLFLAYWKQWLAFLALTGVFVALVFGLDVPGCGRGKLDEACNAQLYVDEKIMGLQHLYGSPTYIRSESCSACSPSYCEPSSSVPAWCARPFDPEGLLATVSAVGNAFLGLQFAHVLQAVPPENHAGRVGIWVPAALVSIGAGLGMHFGGWPLNKNLWSTSYMCFMAGVAAILLTFFYVVVDVLGHRTIFSPLRWMGMNAIFLFAMAAADVADAVISWFYWREPSRNFMHLLQVTWLQGWFGFDWGTFAFVMVKIVFWAIVAGLLYRKKIFFKI
jgi:heparan-alpha-glucosaminide N-acetyltransferase